MQEKQPTLLLRPLTIVLTFRYSTGASLRPKMFSKFEQSVKFKELSKIQA